jgi:hypothetical protein
MSNDSLLLKYTTFHHLNLFLKNKKNQKVVGTTLSHRQDSEKLYLWVILNHYSIYITQMLLLRIILP